jgi:hypothetical protein
LAKLHKAETLASLLRADVVDSNLNSATQ